jgi:hypothetical protein
MAFDTPTRNRLNAFVGDARRLITREFTEKFRSLYGISAEGGIADLAALGHLDEAGLATAALLRARIDYLVRSQPDNKGDVAVAIDRVAREQAFTTLNRLAAVRMAEKRGLITESVGAGYKSKGFQVFERVAGSSLGDTYLRYRRYLFCLFDELAVDLGALFDRRSPQGLLFPREPALLALLELVNAPDLENLWAEDETIGWIYQYYNDEAERKKMREESSAPRNSRELAVRNQFFTPRYVVEFLTDNTLGRTWYEMTKGQTVLKEHCRYLVRRPTEIFLKPGDSAPEEAKSAANLSQEELLQQPVHIPHRPLKDTREIRLLDPACGSMHFGLYAFDLFAVIYDEAWEIAHGPNDAAKSAETFPSFVTFAAGFADKAAFLREVPRLIVEHNLHGIDIDPRAAQIAGLSLWLRAQRAWHQAGVKPADRPRITRSNLVCAEPMPGEKELLREFVELQFPAGERPVFLHLLESIFDKMQLAGEAGSLLRIEEEIRSAIDEARAALAKLQANPKELFSNAELNQASRAPELTGLEAALTTDDRLLTTDFWERAEQRIYDALEAYAEQAENGGGFQRRLFADDAAQGFAFIDLCRKRYDVVVMNPPFGYPSDRSKSYVDEHYPNSKYDVLAAFIDRAGELLWSTGKLGCITSRTVFFIEFFADWRLQLFKQRSLQQFADLGFGVLEALVETAAFTIQNSPRHSSANFVRLLSSTDKEAALSRTVSDSVGGAESAFLFQAYPHEFLAISGYPLAYWVPRSFRSHFERQEKMQRAVGEVRVGLQTGDDFRFIRTAWEVDAKDKGRGHRWVPLAKGGEFRKFYDDIHLLVNWDKAGSEIIECVDDKGKQRSRPQNVACYYRPGLTYPMRTTSNYSPRVLPSGCIFNVQGNSVFEPNNDGNRLLSVLGVLSTLVFESFTRLKARVGDMTSAGGAGFAYTPGLIGSMPFPALTECTSSSLASLVLQCVNLERFKDTSIEPSCLFVLPAMLTARSLSLRQAFITHIASVEERELPALESVGMIEELVQGSYGLTDEDRGEVREQFGVPVASLPIPSKVNVDLLRKVYTTGLTPDVIASNASQQRQLASDRHLRIDEICRVVSVPPGVFVDARRKGAWVRDDEVVDEAAALAQYLLGCAFGRWDIRYATGERPAPELPDPFAPLPVCPPGMLQGDDGLPLSPEAGRRLRTEGRYPLDVAWDGILVDDPEHPLDLERQLQATLAVLWGDRADALESEACSLLGVSTIREWFRRPAGFFADHLKRYSKSRRQAPIYWPLSTATGSYTLWIYYHRLTDQTLHTAIADFIDPKLRSTDHEISAQREKPGGGGSKLAELLEFRGELIDFKAELERIIKLPWKPNLNDGVLITACPLWKLFRLPKWQKDLKSCWQELEKGDYDWAHLAYSIWPKRVEKVCETDRSIAIAHGLEHLCKVAPQKPKKERKAKQPKAESPDGLLEGLEEAGTAAKAAPRSSPSEVSITPRNAAPSQEVPLAGAAPKIDIEDTDRNEVMCRVRQLFGEGGARDRETALKQLSLSLGYQRLGTKVREILERDLLTAVRRGILINNGGHLQLATGGLDAVDRDELKDGFLAAIGRSWIDREEAVRAFARFLGYARTGPILEDTARSLMNGLIRDGRLESDGPNLRRT